MPLALPILILMSCSRGSAFGFERKESCTTPPPPTLILGAGGVLPVPAASKHWHIRWCRIVSVNRLSMCVLGRRHGRTLESHVARVQPVQFGVLGPTVPFLSSLVPLAFVPHLHLLPSDPPCSPSLALRSMPAVGWKKLSEDEVRLAKTWYEKDKVSPAEIALRLDRSKSSLTQLLVQQLPRTPQGAPRKLSEAKVDFLVKRLDELVVKANCKYTVTTKMLQRSSHTKVSERTICDALHRRDIWFRTLREKPVLTPDDVSTRLKFGKKYRSKSKAWWNKTVHAFIDGKHFQVCLNGDSRLRAAQHATFGAYRPQVKAYAAGM